MNKGILNGIAAYALWGFFPIYWKLLYEVPALQLLGHRIAWSSDIGDDWRAMRQILRQSGKDSLIWSADTGEMTEA